MTLVATVGRSASAKLASAGVVLTCPVIALPAYLRHISSFSIVESKIHGSRAAGTYSTVDLPVTAATTSREKTRSNGSSTTGINNRRGSTTSRIVMVVG